MNSDIVFLVLGALIVVTLARLVLGALASRIPVSAPSTPPARTSSRRGIRQFLDTARATGVDVRAVYRRWGDHVISAVYAGLSRQTMMRMMGDHFRAHGV